MDEYRTPDDVWAAAERAGAKATEDNRELAVATFAAATFSALWNRDRRHLAVVLGVDPEEDDEEDTVDMGDPVAVVLPLEDVDAPIGYALGADVPVVGRAG